MFGASVVAGRPCSRSDASDQDTAVVQEDFGHIGKRLHELPSLRIPHVGGSVSAGRILDNGQEQVTLDAIV